MIQHIFCFVLLSKGRSPRLSVHYNYSKRIFLSILHFNGKFRRSNHRKSMHKYADSEVIQNAPSLWISLSYHFCRRPGKLCPYFNMQKSSINLMFGHRAVDLLQMQVLTQKFTWYSSGTSKHPQRSRFGIHPYTMNTSFQLNAWILVLKGCW